MIEVCIIFLLDLFLNLSLLLHEEATMLFF